MIALRQWPTYVVAVVQAAAPCAPKTCTFCLPGMVLQVKWRVLKMVHLGKYTIIG